jgi:hypothetical protein
MFLTKMLRAFLISFIHDTCPAPLSLLDFITPILYGKVYKLIFYEDITRSLVHTFAFNKTKITVSR